MRAEKFGKAMKTLNRSSEVAKNHMYKFLRFANALHYNEYETH